MNIFYLHDDPRLAASYVYDKHKVKMILESAQMLCTAHHVFGNGNNVPYKQAHLNHPSTIWVRDNTHHYYWLYEHMLALGNEYTKRYGKIHLTITKCAEPLLHPPTGMQTKDFELPPQCMPDEYKRPHAIHHNKSLINIRMKWIIQTLLLVKLEMIEIQNQIKLTLAEIMHKG